MPAPPRWSLLALLVAVSPAAAQRVELLPPTMAVERSALADPKPSALAMQVVAARGVFGRGTLWVPTAGAAATLLRWSPAGDALALDFGVRGGIASLLDLSTRSSELMTTDYYVAVPVTVRTGPWATSVALWHESSHLGDEYAARTGTGARAIAHDQFQLRVVRTLRAGMVYAGAHGAAYRWVRDDAGNVSGDRFSAGAELRGRGRRLLGATLRPIVGVDEQRLRGWGWARSTTVAGGVELARDDAEGGALLRVVVTAHDGVAPWWQFGARGMRWVGAGVQWEP